MEWVHCHIARQPVPPVERLNGIPGVVSAIIMKLLAKTAEERYTRRPLAWRGDVTVHMRDVSAAVVGLAESLVRYVMRTHESVILDDASSQNGFSADPYILEQHTRLRAST